MVSKHTSCRSSRASSRSRSARSISPSASAASISAMISGVVRVTTQTVACNRQQRLYFFPLPQGQGSFLPGGRTRSTCWTMAPRDRPAFPHYRTEPPWGQWGEGRVGVVSGGAVSVGAVMGSPVAATTGGMWGVGTTGGAAAAGVGGATGTAVATGTGVIAAGGAVGLVTVTGWVGTRVGAAGSGVARGAGVGWGFAPPVRGAVGIVLAGTRFVAGGALG